MQRWLWILQSKIYLQHNIQRNCSKTWTVTAVTIALIQNTEIDHASLICESVLSVSLCLSLPQGVERDNCTVGFCGSDSQFKEGAEFILRAQAEWLSDFTVWAYNMGICISGSPNSPSLPLPWIPQLWGRLNVCLYVCLSVFLSGSCTRTVGEQGQVEHLISSGAGSFPCLPIWPFPDKMFPGYLKSTDIMKLSQMRLTLVWKSRELIKSLPRRKGSIAEYH